MPVDAQRLGDRRADRHPRVERGVRVLEDHLDRAAAALQLAARRATQTSSPSKTIEPASGSSSRMMQRARVVLPLPDSPTIPSVSVALERERDAVDRRQRGGGGSRSSRLEQRAAQVEALDQAVDLEQRRALARSRRVSGERAGGRGASGPAGSELHRHVGARLAARRAARLERAARRQPREVGRLAGDRARRAALAGASGARAAPRSGATVYGWRGARKSASARRVLDARGPRT